MFFGFLSLFIIYLLHQYITAWIRYYNKTDERFGNSVWRWSYDYQVKGVRDISYLDDKEFVRKRRLRKEGLGAQKKMRRCMQNPILSGIRCFLRHFPAPRTVQSRPQSHK